MNTLIGTLIATMVLGGTVTMPTSSKPPQAETSDNQLIVFEQTPEESLAEQQKAADEEAARLAAIEAEEAKNPVTAGFDYDIASYTTKYSQNKANESRNYNMRLASEAIDGIILKPGDKFSYNETILSHRTPEKDYLPAGVISDGKIVNAIGGGICQISSTLYNAALYSGMTITERRNHSLMVGYLPAGRDATASWGTIDFCFKNDLSVPVMIDSEIGNGVIKIRFLSTKNPQLGEIKIATTKQNNAYYIYRYVDNKIDYSAKSVYAN